MYIAKPLSVLLKGVFGGAKHNTLIEIIVRHFPGASFASVRAFVFEEVDNIVNKYSYLFMDLVV